MKEKISQVVRAERGRDGERLALEWFLAARPGSRLLTCNFRCRQGEVDLVMHDGLRNELVFIEVRFRSDRAWVDGLESVTFRKRMRLSRAIAVYLARSEPAQQPSGVRFDVITVSMNRDGSGDTRVRHYENVALL